jgi:hypothetical protein
MCQGRGGRSEEGTGRRRATKKQEGCDASSPRQRPRYMKVLHVLEDLHGHRHPPSGPEHVADCQGSRRKHTQGRTLLRLTQKNSHTVTREAACEECTDAAEHVLTLRRDHSDGPQRASPPAALALRPPIRRRRRSRRHGEQAAKHRRPSMSEKPWAGTATNRSIERGPWPRELMPYNLGLWPHRRSRRSPWSESDRKRKNNSSPMDDPPIERWSSAGRAGGRAVNPASGEA